MIHNQQDGLKVTKTKFIIFHTKNKKVHITNLTLEYNVNAPSEQFDRALVSTLEQYRDNHADKNCRSYKLLGIHDPS